MFCTFCGAGEARDSICEKCVAEKYIDDVIKHYIYLLNSHPRIMHFACFDWFTQSRLSAHIP